MYISFLKENRRQTLANLDNVDKIEARPKDGVPASETDVWEVAVFYRDERRLDRTGEKKWTGSYDVAARGSEENCRYILNQIIANIENQQPIYVISGR